MPIPLPRKAPYLQKDLTTPLQLSLRTQNPLQIAPPPPLRTSVSRLRINSLLIVVCLTLSRPRQPISLIVQQTLLRSTQPLTTRKALSCSKLQTRQSYTQQRSQRTCLSLKTPMFFYKIVIREDKSFLDFYTYFLHFIGIRKIPIDNL